MAPPLLLLAPLLLSAVGAVSPAVLRMHAVHPDWTLDTAKASDSSAVHTLLFGVRQNNLDLIESIVIDRSDPKSANFRKWLSNAEIRELSANPKGTEATEAWLEEVGAKVQRVTPNGDFITASAPVSTWNAVLGADFLPYRFAPHEARLSTPRITRVFRTKAYTTPEPLVGVLAFIGGTFDFEEAQPLKNLPKLVGPISELNTSRADGQVELDVFNSHYGVDDNTGSPEASQCLFESLGQYYSPSDLAAFNEYYGLPEPETLTVVGGHESDTRCRLNPNTCAEANLDVQYMMGIAQETPTTFWYIAPGGSCAIFLEFAQALAEEDEPPLVNSISYGGCESCNPGYVMECFNTEVMKLAAQGVTFFVSSGDDGVMNAGCKSSYLPSYPATAPYVTAVGATQGPENGKAEIACTSDQGGLITTGGGFSGFYDQPDYQKSAIEGYLAQDDIALGDGYVSTGRGYPDVSSLGHNYPVVIGGNLYLLSGTSASSPAVAAQASLVNAALIAAGKAPGLGFINPMLYDNPDAFNDITSGTNNCCSGGDSSGEPNDPSTLTCFDTVGFNAKPGWDPLTGLGSVDHQNFLNLWLNK